MGSDDHANTVSRAVAATHDVHHQTGKLNTKIAVVQQRELRMHRDCPPLTKHRKPSKKKKEETACPIRIPNVGGRSYITFQIIQNVALYTTG